MPWSSVLDRNVILVPRFITLASSRVPPQRVLLLPVKVEWAKASNKRFVVLASITNKLSFTGAEINYADDYGRTPLHVAASADYSEMVRFLIENGADVHMKTAGEDQTPLHYAAKNEAVQCVKILLAYEADIDARDYKLRTPLQVS